MANIFINGLNLKTGGGRTIFNDYLKFLKKNPQHKYFVLTPNKEEYKKYADTFIIIVDINSFYKHSFFMPFVYYFLFNSLFKKLKIDACFNLCTVPISSKVPQVFMFHNPYIATKIILYKEKRKVFLLKENIVGQIQAILTKKSLKHIKYPICQTRTMAEKIKLKFNLKNDIAIIPNFISSENYNNNNKNFNLPAQGIKLLYLTHYYPHKNIEIFLPLAKKIKKQNLNYKIIITIDSNQHTEAKKILKNIKKQQLEDIIINIGSVKMVNIPSLYKQCHVLLMPTLLESFSACYLEAMLHKLPIFTSGKDFAREVCKDAAIYFDPFDPDSILNQLNKVLNNEKLKNEYIEKGIKRIKEMPSNKDIFEKYNSLIEKAVQSNSN